MSLVSILENVSCAGIEFDSKLPNIVSTVVTVIKVGVPILLIIFGMMDLGKAVIAQKDDEIKKGQQTFIKRCIAAAVVFFIFVIVQLLINVIAGDGDKENVSSCLNCFINNDCTGG